MSEIHALDLIEVSRRLRKRELSAVEVTRAMLARVEALDPELHAFAEFLPEAALEAAERAEREYERGEIRGPLHGVPIAVKDLCAMKGVRTAAGTKVMRDRVPDHTATLVERLQAAGAVILGKLQLTEGAYGWHHPEIQLPVNPWSAEHWTGVSSSGSGVATAAGLCFGSLGSDTGGSIRFPSACCGLVGIKPTYGRVSRDGVFPLAHSLDHIGPMTRSVADAAAMLGVIAGYDPRDPTSLRADVPDYVAELEGDLRGVRIGVDRSYVCDRVDPLSSGAALAALDRFRELGAEVREVELPALEALIAGWAITTSVEVAMAHAETFPSRAEDYGPQLRQLLELGQTVSGADYARVEVERASFKGRLEGLWERVDLLIAPAMPMPPPTVPDSTAGVDDPNLAPLLIFTAPFDYSGSPTISLPGGFSEAGLPLGFQLIGPHLSEALLCRAGHAYQQVTDWHRRRPPGF
ncbi:MAG: amidase [bacterium]|nr:amidase [bacterium]